MRIKKFYAIKVGRKKNVIVRSWAECNKLVSGFSGAEYKSFFSNAEARKWLTKNSKEDTISYKAKKVYAIASGLKNNIIVLNWDKCKSLTERVSNAKYKSFTSIDDAVSWLLKYGDGSNIKIYN